LIEVLREIALGAASAEPQDDQASTYAPRLQKEDGPIDWRLSSQVIHNRVRGLQPWPLAWTWLGGRRLIILKTRIAAAGATGHESLPGVHTAAAGTILGISRDALNVLTGDGVLDVLLVQPEGRRAMSVKDFAAGHHLTVGTRFDDRLALT